MAPNQGQIELPMGHFGIVWLTKATGEVELVDPCQDDRDDILLCRVMGKLKRHWKKNESLETTWWAG